MLAGRVGRASCKRGLHLLQAFADCQAGSVRTFSRTILDSSHGCKQSWLREHPLVSKIVQGLKSSQGQAHSGFEQLRTFSRLPPWESSVRTSGSRLGGWVNQRRRLLPDLSPDTALYGLIGANVAGFCLWVVNPSFMYNHFMTSYQHIRQGRIHTLLTCCFSQRDAGHLFSNMLGLYFFGRSVAYTIGGSGLVALYLAGGMFGSLVYVTEGWLNQRRLEAQGYRIIQAKQPPALGASGAVNAVVIFNVLTYPTATVLIFPLPVPLPAWVLGVFWIGADVSGALGGGRANIGYTVHLGGAAIGALAFYAFRRGRLRRPW